MVAHRRGHLGTTPGGERKDVLCILVVLYCLKYKQLFPLIWGKLCLETAESSPTLELLQSVLMEIWSPGDCALATVFVQCECGVWEKAIPVWTGPLD